MFSWIFIVLVHWNNSPQIDMSPHLDTLSWFEAKQSLLFFLNAARLAEKQQIHVPILKSLLWPDWGLITWTIYHTQGDQDNHYTTDVVKCLCVIISSIDIVYKCIATCMRFNLNISSIYIVYKCIAIRFNFKHILCIHCIQMYSYEV